MTQEAILSGYCPHCGEKLSIPAHLTQFSCMYCGARLTADQLNTAKTPAAEELQAAAYYHDHILEVITNHAGIEKQLTRNGYAPAMDAYADASRKTFECLNTAWEVGVLTLEDAAADFLDQLEAKWTADASRKRKEVLQETDKFQIAVFLVPMIRRLALPCCEPFCETFHAQWLQRYPKALWEIGDFETINAGFKKKAFGLCFITTAVCQQDGKPDNCEELTAFRHFRDGYLRACPDGPDLIDEYYATAPQIVLEIERKADSAARYAEIRTHWLEPCYADLQAGNLQQCKARYTAMVRQLQKEYLH